MRIGVNARLLLSQNMEGMSRYIYETTKNMAISNPDDTFILFYDRFDRKKLEFPSNVSHVAIPLPTRHPVLWYLWFELLVPVFLSKYKIDVFYSGDGYMSLNTNIPTILVVHDLAYLHYPHHVRSAILSYYQKNIPKFLTAAHQIVTVSQFVKKDITARFNISDDKINVIYNAVNKNINLIDFSNLSPKIANIPKSLPYFIYVGSLHPRKNIIRLIQAFNLFNEPQESKFKLILAGRMAWKTDEIKDEIQKTKYVEYLGMVSEEEKAFLIKNAVALVYVSLFEGFGIPILESMQLQTPVITSSVSSMPEVAGGAALLADPENTASISECFSLITKDNSLRTELILKGKKRVLDFSWQDSSEKIYRLLTDAAKKEITFDPKN